MRKHEGMGPSLGPGAHGRFTFPSKQKAEEYYKELYKSATRGTGQAPIQVPLGVALRPLAVEDAKRTPRCDIPVSKLEVITIHDLDPFFGRPASGCVLRVTIIRAPCLQQYAPRPAIQLLVADAENTVLQLSLPHVYHSKWRQNYLWSLPGILNTFSAGSRMQLKEPRLELHPSGMPSIRLDHHSNVEFEEPAKDTNLELMEQFREKGSGYFVKKEFENAIKVYNGGLRFANSLPYSSWTRETAAYIVEVNNTLAELYLRLNRHPEARQAAEAAFSLEPRHFRARYSLALANSLCGRHAEAVAGFRGLLWEVGNAEGETRWEREDDQELEDWEDRGGVGEKDLEVLLFHALKKAERRAKDARGGFFLFLSLYSYFPVGGMGGENDGASTAAAAALGAAREFLRRLLKEEVAPYVGPVEIRRAGRGWNGKGLFVTENVKADTIVLVEKAVAVMALSTEGDDEGDDGKGGGEEETPMTLYSKGMETLARVLRERAGKDRLANARLLSLSAAEIPPLDLFRTDCPETDETLEGIRPDEGVEAWLGKVLIKPSDVQQIVGCNVIATGSGARGAAAEITALTTVGTGAVAAALARVRLLTEEEKTATAGKKAKRIHMTVGLWPLAAFTVKLDPTHPPTVGRMRVGKYMIVRASRDLKKGEALFCKPGAGQAAREGRSGEEVREARGKGKVKGN